MVGGPIGLERGFVLHQTPANTIEWLSTLQITNDIALTGSKDILTALGDISDRILAFECGADDYLIKPFSPSPCNTLTEFLHLFLKTNFVS